MDNLMIFESQDFGTIKTILKDGEPIFLANPLSEILGYSKTNSMVRRSDDDEKMEISSKEVGDILGCTLHELGISKFAPSIMFITESGLYNAILGSDKKEAKKFKRWVTSEVLPQIRKTGGYIPIENEMSDDEIMAKALMVAQKTINKKDELLKAKEKELIEVKEDLTKKDNFISQITESENSLKVADVAQIASKKGIKIGQNRLWQKLRDWGLIKKNSKYDPKQEYIERGYFEVVQGAKENSKGVFTYKTTKVLGKGQVYIINRLLEEQNLKIS